MDNNIFQQIKDADMILVGIGEEFNGGKYCREVSGYKETIEAIGKKLPWLQPVYRDSVLGEKQDEIRKVLLKLSALLEEKNHFVISTSTNAIVSEIPWKYGFVTLPCGSMTHKQCSLGCDNVLDNVTKKEISELQSLLKADKVLDNDSYTDVLGTCPQCGAPMVLNNYYHEKYNETAYIEKWQLYTKWLQGTLNRRLLILELGSEFECPSVMRWPFEKIAFYNQKAEMIRVNERLYQLTEELKGKGQAIQQNAIEWLQGL